MVITKHAEQRWGERCEGLDIHHEYLRATKRLSKKDKRVLREACKHHQEYLTREYNGRYLRKTPEDIVFVIGPGEVIITVFHLNKGVDKDANRR